jgi:hypothetical protein
MKAILLILMLVATQAQAYDFEIGIGRTQYTRSLNGIWWQSLYEHHERMTGNAFNLGVTGMVADGWRGRVGYEYLGRTTSNCLATDDASFAAALLGVKNTAQPSQRAIGYGEIHMLYGTVGYEFKIHDFAVTPEFGMNAYIPTWDVNVYNLQGKYLYKFHHTERVEVTPSLGVSVGYGKISVALTVYKHIGAGGDWNPAIYEGKAINLSVRQTF